MNKDNFTMLCDFYELTMANGYFKNGFYKRTTYFDVFFRNVPDNGGFAIAAGLDQIIEYIKELHFSAEDIEFLRSKKIFDEEFLEYLKDFRFTGDIYAVPEGTPARACPYRKGTGYRGTAYRNLYPACDKSPVAYSHKSEQNSQSGKRQNSA